MKTIGLICEGVSEINVMHRIVSKYLGEDVFVHAVEPDTTAKGGHLVQSGYGGWEFYQDIKGRMVANISPAVLAKYDGRILFAICDNEIECWLLPLYYTDYNRCKTHNCIHTLNQALGKKNIGGIPDKAKNDPNARTVYGKILKNFKNKKSIQDCAQYHYGFGELTKQLDQVKV